MNILYISKLSGNLYAGPNNSVPAQIGAQKQIDNTFWYNLNHVKRKEWIELECKNLDDYPSGRLCDLPEPFNCPDLAIVEEFYCHPFSRIIRDIQKQKIPYIVIPRSELTYQAQNKKRFKKRIGNLVYFNSMAKKAVAIQYLSKQEQLESQEKWKTKSFIIPNGTTEKTIIKESFSTDLINAVYIGRYEKYQKGLDLLFQAVGAFQSKLRENGFKLHMYGVDQENTIDTLNKEIQERKIEDLIEINGSVFGKDKEQILLSADLFIMTSRFEGMPMGMIEALSYGVPVIATIGTNMSEVIEDYKAGWTSDNSVDGIIDSFNSMLKNKDNLKPIGRNALELASLYSWQSIAIESHKRYQELLK